MKFEQEFQRLEEILVRLERGELSLDESLGAYEQGVGALRACRELLAQAERRIEELTPGPDGPSLRPVAAGASSPAKEDA